MIGSLGGATIDSDGNRNYPGSGGAVGGLSFPGGNWAYFGGAGAMYNRFTPNNSNLDAAISGDNVMMRIQPGDGICSPDLGFPCPGGGDDIIIHPQVTTNNPCAGNSAQSCATTDIPIEKPPLSQSGLDDLIAGLLAPGSRTSVASVPPIFSFNPNTSGGSGVDMKKIGIIAIVILVAFFAYKKYGSKLASA